MIGNCSFSQLNYRDKTCKVYKNRIEWNRFLLDTDSLIFRKVPNFLLLFSGCQVLLLTPDCCSDDQEKDCDYRLTAARYAQIENAIAY